MLFFLRIQQCPWFLIIFQSKCRPSQSITNQLSDPCYTPQGMATEPLRYPNLVTGFERNPGHAARAALYTRFTPYEWTQNQISFFNESDANRHYADKLHQDTVRLMRYCQ